MRTRLIRSAAILAALAAVGIGGAAFASAGGSSHHLIRSHAAVAPKTRPSVPRASAEDPGGREQQGEDSSAPEADNDASAQAAACQKAGIDPNGDNVQYDDQTGACSLDTGGNAGNSNR